MDLVRIEIFLKQLLAQSYEGYTFTVHDGDREATVQKTLIRAVISTHILCRLFNSKLFFF